MAQSQSAMMDSTCKVCVGSWPRQNHFIADLGLSNAFLHEDQFFPGWTVVVLKHHATELFHLAPTERIQLLEEVNIVAKTLSQVYEARKINYELLGNQLPHIHWHVIPRLASDPAPREPVWQVPHSALSLSIEQVQSAIAHIKQRLFALPKL
jgi:diadenosine tetraphosphate (Ap4A) HIT family hydrolase